jgi:hypothetical protein
MKSGGWPSSHSVDRALTSSVADVRRSDGTAGFEGSSHCESAGELFGELDDVMALTGAAVGVQ